jgi:hypothetical protein
MRLQISLNKPSAIKLTRSNVLMVLIAVGFISTACGKITITGKSKGAGDDASEVRMTRGDVDSIGTLRLIGLEGQAEEKILRDPAFQLKVEVTGNPEDLKETYHFLVAVQGEGSFSGGTSEDRKFIVNNIGKLVHLSRRQGDDDQETAMSGRFHVGTTSMAIVQDGDRVVPWTVQQSDAGNRCLPLGGSDCFDMKSLTKKLFRSISDTVVETVTDNVPNGRVTDQALHFVPRIVHKGHEDSGRRARGFGFVYEATIETPIGAVNVLVPVSILFLFSERTYVVDIDPLSFGNSAPHPENLNRIFVKALPGPNLIFLLEGTIRDNIVDGIKEAEMPELVAGVEFSTTLLLGFNTAAGANEPLSGNPPRVYPSYEVILLPDSNDRVVSTKVWSRSGDDDIEEEQAIRLVFIE